MEILEETIMAEVHNQAIETPGVQVYRAKMAGR
jgi:hypothetical protein